VEVNPEDATRLGIGQGDLVEIVSRQGRWEGPAIVVDTVRRGEVFIPFHYGNGNGAANQHTLYARDPVSKQPQFKSSPVAVYRLGFGVPEPWMLARLQELDGARTEPYATRKYDSDATQTVP
jgi:predicted molibdopterin-dependent oxidoreductase YjgC